MKMTITLKMVIKTALMIWRQRGVKLRVSFLVMLPEMLVYDVIVRDKGDENVPSA